MEEMLNQEQQITPETPLAEQSFEVPGEYKDKGWAEKIKSSDDLFKAYDNAQSLIGKRPAGIPSQDATDTEWDSFYKAMGRPDEPSYNFTDPEGLPEGFDTADFKETASQILHKAGLTQRQADAVYSAYLQSEITAAEKEGEATAERQTALDAQYDALTAEHFGDDAAKYEELTQQEFSKHVPQSLKETFAKITDMPDVLTALMSYTKGKQGEIDQIRKEYTGEGSLTSGGQAATSGINETRQELAKLKTSAIAKDFTHPEHKATRERILQLQGAVQSYYKT